MDRHRLVLICIFAAIIWGIAACWSGAADATLIFLGAV